MIKAMRVELAGPAIGALMLSGCAATPDVTLTYYRAKTELSVELVQTVTCTLQDIPVVANSAKVLAVHSANLEDPQPIRIADLDGFLSNSEIGFDFYADGRLQGVNATSTGQGETILKSAIAVAAAVVAFDVTSPYEKECNFINGVKEKGDNKREKAMTVQFRGKIDPEHEGLVEICVKPEFLEQYNNLRRVLGVAKVKAEPAIKPAPPVKPNFDVEDAVVLNMRQPAFVQISVRVGEGGAVDSAGWEIFNDFARVSNLGEEYRIPIPKAALFGKHTFNMTVDGSGALTKLSYNKETGAGQILAVGTEALNAFEGPSAEEEAKELKAEGDIIAYQQRLVRCQVDPVNCT